MKQKTRATLSDALSRISGAALYDGLLGDGLFADKLPPVFTSRPFCDWCKSKSFSSAPDFPKKGTPYVTVDCMRNTNVPRVMGVPNPFTYDYLCAFLRDHWDKIRKFFRTHTHNQGHKVSQLHLQRMRGTASLFKMNYHRKDENCDPLLPELMMGNRYEVDTDISNFFPSVYSHSLVWALESKEWAKGKQHEGWQNELDHRVRMIKYDETNGLLIGPHVSNLLSEIILVRVDEKLCDSKDWKYVRCIDDCTCYAVSKEAAERFIVEQSAALKEYGLALNQKKTRVIEMPNPSESRWLRELTDYLAGLSDLIDLGTIRACIDFLLELLRETGDCAVLSYAMSPLSKKQFTEPARLYYVRYVLHLASIYPYLYRYLDERLFQPFGVELVLLQGFFKQMYEHGLEARNYEEVSYALYFSVRYGIRIEDYDVSQIIGANDCVLLCLALIYTRAWKLDETPLHDHAITLQKKGLFWEYWLFAYEALRHPEFKGIGSDNGGFKKYLQAIKKDKISFYKPVDSLSAVFSVLWETSYMKWNLSYVPDQANPADLGPLASIWEEFAAAYPAEANEEAKAYLNAIVANLYVGRFTQHNVSVPYRDETIVLHNENGPTGDTISAAVMRRVLGWLEKQGYVGSRVGNLAEGEGIYYGARNPLGQLFSRMRTESIRRKQIGQPDSAVLMKDADKNVIDNPLFSEKAAHYADALQNINATYSRHTFELDVGHGGSMQQFAPRLRAVFNNGSWDLGGRLYAGLTIFGLNYQNVPSEMRRTIMVDGSSCVELDYSALHINILYAQKGLSLGRVDPYACGDARLRPLVKKALLILINAQSREVVLYKLEEWRKELLAASDLTSREQEAKDAFLCCGDLDKLLTAIERKHTPIADQFYTGVGLRLQNIDSQIALAVVSHFSDLDVPVLPVHDSFIAPKAYADELRQVMLDEYCRICGGSGCGIKGC